MPQGSRALKPDAAYTLARIEGEKILHALPDAQLSGASRKDRLIRVQHCMAYWSTQSGPMLTSSCGTAAAVTVTGAVADLRVSCTDVAVTVANPAPVGACGVPRRVNRPLAGTPSDLRAVGARAGHSCGAL